ncbi:MAG TPA: tRNA pseudouridine(38-40) synthase TruA [Crenotrichaceae bacterium]|nr:tRNA pseudouridine(38-40) synthase TruA [Crenotrichaceae bacterium]
MRIALGIEYDGTAYHGWQFQSNCQSVQACVDRAVSQVANEQITVVCAGRTDAGVHALEQVVHFDTSAQRVHYAWLLGVNNYLPDDIRIIWAQPVANTFHARTSAIARSYHYGILNRQVHSALDRHRLCWYNRQLDEKAMQQAASYLIGEHDFSSFRSAGCQSKSPYRRLYVIDVYRDGEKLWVKIIGNAFLHHMIRNIIGVLLKVGSGQHQPAWANEVLQARDRKVAGITATAGGVYFAGILYPPEFSLPKTAEFEQLPKTLSRIDTHHV